MKVKCTCIVALVTVCIILVACTQKKKDDGLVHIGFSMATLNEERWVCDKAMLTEAAAQRNCEISITNANGNPDEQYEDVVELINDGIDVLVYVPQDFHYASEIVKYAGKNNVPVISYDRFADNSGVDAYISFDNYKIGALQAQEMLKCAPYGEYIIIRGPESDKNSQYIYDGVMSVLGTSNIKIADEFQVSYWKKEEAYDFVLESLEKNSHITGIIAANDSLAWGASNAVSVAGYSGKIAIAGQDADLTACRRIIDNIQSVTIYKPIYKLAQMTADMCCRLARGEEIESNKTIYNGNKQIPEVLIDVEAVNSANIDSVLIESGFYSYEHLYG